MTTLTLVVVARSQEELAEFPLANVLGVADELVLLANPGKRFGGLSAIGNRMLDRSTCDVVALVHADTSFGAGALAMFAQEDRVTGLVGRALDGRYIWSKEAQQWMLVSTLDCCSVFIPRASGLRFDEENFDSFHCCVEDLCIEAASRGITVQVPPAEASHLGVTGPDLAWQAEYAKYRAKLASKWSHAPSFITT